MSWTDERIELLQKLWLQGMSASKIASELANGLTRNAVIGKVYRLGLSGRTKADAPPATQQASKPPVRPHAGRPAPHPAQSRGGPTQGGHGHGVSGHLAQAQISPNTSFIRGNTALAVQPVAFATPAPAPSRDVVVPIAEPVTMLELRESMCRWPIGDPTQADFRFCGARKTPGEGPYCGCHAAIAYQPQQDRRRQRPQKSS
ncbi:GcrA cell cycle regulator [Methylocella tundrae]|uniref:GcrA cell cycle regulator n=1 Tax=Methylocella tundrae TaxID=227605 RepID=A0A8B6M633_METTU|nr:GcrA family cell cycle regulator [Methylocella tundrae]VTZ49869.1 GcrA cell cycle regulator [Methylocella tundrae]